MVNPVGRPVRAQETRENEARRVLWKPAHDLPVPDAQDGYVYYWKRASMMGVSDPANMARARREGWVPCRLEDHPEMASDYAAFGLPTTGLIEIGGLILCKTTTESWNAQKQYYQNKSQAEMSAVDNNFMRESDPRMPLFSDRKSKVSFGSGS